MFFIFICINLVLYISSGVSYFNGDAKKAIILGSIALIFSIFTFIFYKNKMRKRKSSKDTDISDEVCDCISMNPDFLFGMKPKGGFDCSDADCGGADCGGIDCTP